METSAVALECKVEAGTAIVHLAGAWRLRSLPAVAAALHGFAVPRAGHVVLDGSRLESIDTAGGFLLLDHLAELGCPPAAIGKRHFGEKQDRLAGSRAQPHARAVRAPEAASRTPVPRRRRDRRPRCRSSARGVIHGIRGPGAARAGAPSGSLPAARDGGAIRVGVHRRDPDRAPRELPHRHRGGLRPRRGGAALWSGHLRGRRHRARRVPRAFADPGLGARRRPFGCRVHRGDRHDESRGRGRCDRHPRPVSGAGAGHPSPAGARLGHAVAGAGGRRRGRGGRRLRRRFEARHRARASSSIACTRRSRCGTSSWASARRRSSPCSSR